MDHKEWRFATARLAEDEVYVNAVCTYGIASAQWWWGSQGAALHRIILHFFEGDSDVYGLLFVDDWLWLLPVLRYWPGITVILVITMMLGTPVKWSKVTAGVQGTYVSGLATMVTTYVAMEVGIDEGKGRCVAKRLYDLARAEYTCKQELLEIAGFLVWATCVLDMLRPLLQPFFAFAAGRSGKFRVPPLIRFVATYFQGLLGAMFHARMISAQIIIN